MFNEVLDVIDANKGRVTELKVTLVVKDATGTVRITDIMLQGGGLSTKWTGHPSEIKWTVDG